MFCNKLIAKTDIFVANQTPKQQEHGNHSHHLHSLLSFLHQTKKNNDMVTHQSN